MDTSSITTRSCHVSGSTLAASLGNEVVLESEDPCIIMTPGSTRVFLERKIERHLITVSALRLQLNKLVPISRLPPEIISSIFSIVKALDSDWLKWIKITHVCNYWREVALKFPRLWEHPPLENARWTEEMLNRSKSISLPLIKFDFDSSSTTRALQGLKQVLYHASRIKHLALLNAGPMFQTFLNELPTYFPQLEVLSISGATPRSRRSGVGTGSNDYPQQVRVPNDVLRGAQILRRLELSSCKVDWTSHHISKTITHLKLHDIVEITRPTLEIFVTALEHLAELEHLDLKNAFPSTPLQRDAPVRRVYLDRIKKLEISSTNSEVDLFFRHIAFPRCALVDVSSHDIDESARDDHFSLTLSDIAQSYSDSVCDLKFGTLIMDEPDSYPSGDTESGVRLRVFAAVAKNRSDLLSHTEHLKISLTWNSANILTKNVISELFKNGLPIEDVSHVHLQFSNSIDPETITRTVGRLPKVCFVKAGRRTAFVVTQSLQFLNDSNASVVRPKPLFFPSISTICMERAFFRKMYSSDTSPYLTVERLEDCFIQRYEQHAQIISLGLISCFGLNQQCVDRLKQVIVDVDWDGRDLDSDGYEDEDYLSD